MAKLCLESLSTPRELDERNIKLNNKARDGSVHDINCSSRALLFLVGRCGKLNLPFRFSKSLIAFWDGKSKGTKMVIEYAEKVGKECRIVMTE